MTEAFIERAKYALKNLMSCDDVLKSWWSSKHAYYCWNNKTLGPLWKLITLCEMGVDVPAKAVEFMLRKQDSWKKLREKRKKADYLHYRNKLKLKASERHTSEKEHMVTLNAVRYTTRILL